MNKRIIYLECPYCGWRVLKSVLIGKKWKPEKTVICDECDCESELAEWNWYEKHTVPFFRELNFEETKAFIV